MREPTPATERAVLLCDNQVIAPSQLPREISGDATDEPAQKTDSSLWGYEKAMIVKALKENGWNQTRAAKALGISRDNLRYRLKKYEIDRPE